MNEQMKSKKKRILHGQWNTGADGADVGIDAEGFARLIPLLGEDLPLSRVERLFEEVDADRNGSLDFDEFVLLVRRLKPRAVGRNGRVAALNAFETLTAPRGRARTLRASVPYARRTQAGLLLLTLRDFGYDDDQILGFLQALYPPVHTASTDGPAASSMNSRAPTASKQSSDKQAADRAAEFDIRTIAGAWDSLGGGELVHLPVNPFDFRRRAMPTSAGLAAKEALLRAAERWQCAVGIETGVFMDLLTLLGETAFPLNGGVWPPEVTASLFADDLGGGQDISLPFPDFCHAIVEMRSALEAAFAHEEAMREAGQNPEEASALQPFQALMGPRPPSLTDESFANPLRHLSKGEARPTSTKDLRDCCSVTSTPAWIENVDLKVLSTVSARVQDELMHGVIDPILSAGESVEPLFPLSASTRKLIPHWQEPAIIESVLALRRSGFPASDVDTLIASLYLAKQRGDEGKEAVLRAWRVLRFHASEFAKPLEEEEEAPDPSNGRSGSMRHKQKKGGLPRRRRMLASRAESDDGDMDAIKLEEADRGHRLTIQETFRYDHHTLEKEACKRMIRLFTESLVRKEQLEALFNDFDMNRDGSISVDELHVLLRVCDPFKRLAKLRPVEMPKKVTALDTATAAAMEAVAPTLVQVETLWRRFNPFANDDDDVDDNGDADGDS